MSKLTGFSVEDIVNATPPKGVGETQEPQLDQLGTKLRRLQQDERILEEEIKELKTASNTLQKVLLTLQIEAYKLEGIHKEKQDFCRKLQFQFEETEQDCARLIKQNKNSEELMEQYRCEIQELKLKHRKQRMKFEKQLHQLIEQHKNLSSIFNPERLPGEIKNTENRKLQLVSAEQLKLAQLYRLDEELEDASKMKQWETTAAGTMEQ